MSGSAPRLVATDVDGTLLGPDERVPAANRAVVEDVVSSGALFVLATGRPPRWLGQVVDQLTVAPLAVCANGAVVTETAGGRHLVTHELDPEVLQQIDVVLRRCLPGYGIAAERLGEDAADAEFVASPDYRHAWLHPEHLDVGHAEVLERPALKLLARVPGMSSADMVAALGGEVDELADVTYSTTNGLIEFACRGVTKASALAAIAEGLAGEGSVGGGAAGGGAAGDAGVPFSVAFGDMPNDIEMLRWAGLGVAMGNALEPVKAAADEVTLSNAEAGLAHVLRRWWG